MIDGLFNVPGVSFWIQGTGDSETVQIRVRWTDEAMEELGERFGCAPAPPAIRAAIVAGMCELFGEGTREVLCA